MTDHIETVSAPRFGTATLEDCERELIHLAGSIQPHGALLVLSEPDHRVLQASLNTGRHLGVPHDRLLSRPLGEHLPRLGARLESLSRGGLEELRHALRFRIGDGPGEGRVALVHRVAGTGLVVEVERDQRSGLAGICPDASPSDPLSARLTAAIRELGGARGRRELYERTVEVVRDLTGYDRVMVYRFDPEGHGEVVAEDRRDDLEPYLGLHYPASDIPQRARTLYRLNRIRVLVDVDYDPVPVRSRAPSEESGGGEELDMSLCYLRSMSPIHIQYLKNMGVSATLVSSIVTGERLWGLIACHHYSPRDIHYEARAACTLLSEIFSARLGVLESLEFAEAELHVRHLESRLVAATGAGEDWRREFFREPDRLLDRVGASGVALYYEGAFHTGGHVPPEEDLARILEWIRSEAGDTVFHCASVPKANPELSDVAGTVSGILATPIDARAGEYLVWTRRERIEEVQWAGDPRKPVEYGDEPGDLSPRRSFAVWSELVRGTARPWETPEIAIAEMVGRTLRDLVVQIQAMRLLLISREMQRLRDRVRGARLPTVLADAEGRVLLANSALAEVVRQPAAPLQNLADVPALFRDPSRVRGILNGLRPDEPYWEGELRLVTGREQHVPVAVRADLIPDGRGGAVGYVLILTDLRKVRETEVARDRLFATLLAEHPMSFRGATAGDERRDGREPGTELLEAIVTNAQNAVATSGSTAGGRSLTAIEEATRRAAELARCLLRFTRE